MLIPPRPWIGQFRLAKLATTPQRQHSIIYYTLFVKIYDILSVFFFPIIEDASFNISLLEAAHRGHQFLKGQRFNVAMWTSQSFRKHREHNTAQDICLKTVYGVGHSFAISMRFLFFLFNLLLCSTSWWDTVGVQDSIKNSQDVFLMLSSHNSLIHDVRRADMWWYDNDMGGQYGCPEVSWPRRCADTHFGTPVPICTVNETTCVAEWRPTGCDLMHPCVSSSDFPPEIYNMKCIWKKKKIYIYYIYTKYMKCPCVFTLPLWDPDLFWSWTLRSLRTMISVGFVESPWDAMVFSRIFSFFRQVRHVWMLECWTPRSWSSELWWWENSCYCTYLYMT